MVIEAHMPKTITSKEIARRQAVGRRVVQALESVELTQSDIARRTKVPPGNFSRMLRGERLLAPYLGKIARVCNVALSWLVNGEKGGPGATGDSRGHGRHPNPDRFLWQLSPSEREALLPRAREAWLLPGPWLIVSSPAPSGPHASGPPPTHPRAIGCCWL